MSETAPQTQTAITRTPIANVERFQALDFATPGVLDTTLRFATVLVASRLTPRSVQTPEQAFYIIVIGRELGLGPAASLRHIHIIDGKPTMSAEMMLTRFRARGGHAKWLKDDGETAELWIKAPNGDEHVGRFTAADAQMAGLLGKDNWKKYKAAMLRARAITLTLRALGEAEGLYDPDELGAVTNADGEVIDVQPSAAGQAQSDAFAQTVERWLTEIRATTTIAEYESVVARLRRETQAVQLAVSPGALAHKAKLTTPAAPAESGANADDQDEGSSDDRWPSSWNDKEKRSGAKSSKVKAWYGLAGKLGITQTDARRRDEREFAQSLVEWRDVKRYLDVMTEAVDKGLAFEHGAIVNAPPDGPEGPENPEQAQPTMAEQDIPW